MLKARAAIIAVVGDKASGFSSCFSSVRRLESWQSELYTRAHRWREKRKKWGGEGEGEEGRRRGRGIREKKRFERDELERLSKETTILETFSFHVPIVGDK